MDVYNRRGVTCQISAFEIGNPPNDPSTLDRKWVAIATAHAYDPSVRVAGFKPGQEALVGETMRVFSGRAFGDTEAQAMSAALQALLFELTAKGFSANHDVKLW